MLLNHVHKITDATFHQCYIKGLLAVCQLNIEELCGARPCKKILLRNSKVNRVLFHAGDGRQRRWHCTVSVSAWLGAIKPAAFLPAR